MGDPALYLLGDEFAAEIANRTVRAVMQAARTEAVPIAVSWPSS